MPNSISSPFTNGDGGSLPPGSAVIAASASSALRTLSARLAGSVYVLNVAVVDSSGNQLSDFSLSGLEIPAHDYIALTYVAAGNGVGEIYTVAFKSGGAGGTTVATLTLGYDASNRLSTVTKS